MPAVKTLDKELLAGVRLGTWVAISQDQKRVAGTGRTLKAALRKAKKNGEKRPFILRVPKNAALIL